MTFDNGRLRQKMPNPSLKDSHKNFDKVTNNQRVMNRRRKYSLNPSFKKLGLEKTIKIV